MATKKATEKKIANRIEDTFENVGASAKDFNDYVLKSTEKVLDIAVDRGEQWQELGSKALDKGFKLAANQQDIVFDSLEVVKGQLVKGTKRMRALFSNK